MGFDASGTFTRWGGANIWKGDAAAGTKILATRHDDHDQELANGLSECLTRSGKGVPTTDIPWGNRKLTNLAAPTADTDAVTKGYVDAAITAAQTAMAMPPGVMMPYTKSGTFPTGWLYCNGQAISRATYAALYALIGTTFGTGDGVTTFNLPDMRGRFPRGWNDNATLDPARVFGSTQTDDFESHAHTAISGTESADHTHTFGGTTVSTGNHGHTTQADNNWWTVNAGTTNSVPRYATQATGGDGSHSHTYSGTTAGRSVAHTHAITVNPVGGPETRPHNVALAWIIKT